MAKRQPMRIYQRLPRRRVRLRALLWLVIGFSCVATGAAGWLLIVLNSTIPSSASFVGQLSPDADPIIVTLPKGAILKDIHVPRNAQIQRGQTVATLDSEAMERRINLLSAELLHDDLLRECLLVQELPESAFFVELPEVAQDHARLAQQDCQVILDEKARITERVRQDQDLKAEERALVDRYIAILTHSQFNNVPSPVRENDARQALALTLLRNRLNQEMATLHFDGAKDGAEWQRDRIDLIRTLGEQIRTKSELRHQMRALLLRPRLQAPEDGFVVQVRSVPRDRPMREDVDMIVLRPQDGVGYQASFVVPHHQLDMVSGGNRVQMSMLGMIDGGPLLTGEVTALQSTGQPSVRATVTLDNESIAHLDDPRNGVALRGLGTASIIRVQKTDLKVAGVLKSVLQRAFPISDRGWFYDNLLNGEDETVPVIPDLSSRI